MELEKAKTVCHALRFKYGNTSIDIQGGEPTIWRHIEELVSYCREIGLYPTLITNAIALANRDKCLRLRTAGLRDLKISVQGLGPVYDEIVGLPGGSAKQAQALQNCIELGIPFRFNCVMSVKALPQLADIARLAVSAGALAVNFLAFTPFADQATGKRSVENVPRYSDVAVELTNALDVLDAGGVEANVRYLPMCMVEERHRSTIYNFQQLSYDAQEWDFDSWSWSQQQPQRMKWGPTSGHHESLASITYSSWVFGADRSVRRIAKSAVKRALGRFPHARAALKRMYRRSVARADKIRRAVLTSTGRHRSAVVAQDELGRAPAIYRDHAIVRAFDHTGYQYSPLCDKCDVKTICDGFHRDYAELFTADEASPIQLGEEVTDPLHFVRDQVKIYEPEEMSRPFTAELVSAGGAPT
jgi:hypothetical protein